MGPLQRRLHRGINPISTGLTIWWLGAGRRQVPPGPLPEGGSPATRLAVRTFVGVRSPGSWAVPAGRRPGWDWLPEYRARPNLRAVPRWARLWYRVPLIDRYAYEWMWWHGGWSVLVPVDTPPSAARLSGVRMQSPR
jgi:hypothetical protein